MDQKNKTVHLTETELEHLTEEELAPLCDYELSETSIVLEGKEFEERLKHKRDSVSPEAKPPISKLPPNFSPKGTSKGPPPPPKEEAPPKKQIIDNRYEVSKCLGQGAMGAVYEVRHLRLDKLFAMKSIHPELAKDEKCIARFHREAAALSRLDHPNCVGVTDFGQTPNGDYYLVMDCVEGEVIADLVDRSPLSISESIEITRQILLGLGHAHDAGIIHRDIKLENLIRTDSEKGPFQIKILDFGLAKEKMPSKDQAQITEAGMVLGTPQYIAPEVIITQMMNPQTDLYAVGVALFKMLIGKHVFPGDDIAEIIQAKVKNPAPTLNSVGCGKFPSSLEDFLIKSLAEPQTRFKTAAEMLEALEDVAHKISWSAKLATAAHIGQEKTKQATKAVIKYGGKAGVFTIEGSKKIGSGLQVVFKKAWETIPPAAGKQWHTLVEKTKERYKQSIKRLPKHVPEKVNESSKSSLPEDGGKSGK